MRVVFFGTPDFAVPALDAAIEAAEVVAVVSQPDRRAGRGRALRRPPVARRADELGIPVLQPERASAVEFCQALSALEPALGIVVAYGEIFRQRLLDIPPLGLFNVHASLLPRWRGASPIAAAIQAGDRSSGVTLFKLVRGMDAGPVLLELETEIGARETAGQLHDRLALLGAEAVRAGIAQLGQGAVELVAQDEALVTVCGKLSGKDGRIDWSEPASALDRQVRALTPWPAAHTRLPDNQRLILAEVEPVDGEGLPGQRLEGTIDALHVACGEGALAIRRVKPAGRREMSVADYLRGNALPADARFT